MTFKAKADKGYVAVWTYKGESYVGDEYTVKMGANDAKLYVEFMDKDDIRLTELPFRDVSNRDWYYDDVVYVYHQRLHGRHVLDPLRRRLEHDPWSDRHHPVETDRRTESDEETTRSPTFRPASITTTPSPGPMTQALSTASTRVPSSPIRTSPASSLPRFCTAMPST